MKTTLAGILIILLISVGCRKDKIETYLVETNQSSITWTGASPVAENTGTFSVTGSNLKVKEGKLVNGSFSIPINSLNVTNLPPDLKGQLTNHLLSPDFFNVILHPMAVFKIEHVKALTGTVPDGSVANANYLISGYLTMIGVTKPVSFPAKINLKHNKLTAEAILKINRTDWGMNYAADPGLGEHHIFPLVNLKINLTANQN